MVTDHGPALYRIAYRMIGDRHEAEDLVQETFRSAWKSRELFRSGGHERAWLAAILRHRAADHRRRRKPPTVPAGDNSFEVGCADRDVFRDELSDEVQRAVETLPHDLRETLLLVVVAELTHQETADLLGLPLGTILSRVSRARQRLRTFLLGTSKYGSQSQALDGKS